MTTKQVWVRIGSYANYEDVVQFTHLLIDSLQQELISFRNRKEEILAEAEALDGKAYFYLQAPVFFGAFSVIHCDHSADFPSVSFVLGSPPGKGEGGK